MQEMFTYSKNTLRVKLPAEIDHHNSAWISKETDRLVQNLHICRIVFDFTDTVFMDSSGVGMIMGRYKLLRFMGGTVIADGINERIRKILELSGIGRVIDIYKNA